MRNIYENAKFAYRFPGTFVLIGLCAVDAYAVAPLVNRVKTLRQKV